MAEGDHADGGSEAGLDSEWEYEYSHDDTEEFYFILDFPIPVEPETEPNFTKRATIVKFPSTEIVSNDKRNGSVTPEWDPAQGVTQHGSVKDDIQITDLHTTHPLVAYKKQIYTCDWASTLGTDMLFCRPSEAGPQPADPPSRLVATTSAKLVAKPVEVKPKSTKLYMNPEPAPSVTDAQEDGVTQRARSQRQTDFSEKLQAIKLQRGELDTVSTEPILTLSRPVDWMDQAKHEQARKEHTDRKRKPNPDQDTPEGSGSRRKQSKTNEKAPQLHQAGPATRVSRSAGRKSNGGSRNLQGFPTRNGGNGEGRQYNGDADGENDFASISTPTPARFDFIETEAGERVATVPQENMQDM
ncbi:MAG: hypothetical protein M1821_002208 [Bathelium mastoideum]|nr:MAG: hypothetical protein M1821_002208 [Bathelium mastoideum]